MSLGKLFPACSLEPVPLDCPHFIQADREGNRPEIDTNSSERPTGSTVSGLHRSTMRVMMSNCNGGWMRNGNMGQSLIWEFRAICTRQFACSRFISVFPVLRKQPSPPSKVISAYQLGILQVIDHDEFFRQESPFGPPLSTFG